MRKPMVTRTFVSTKVVAMCVDLANPKETFTESFIVPRTYATLDKLEKAVKKAYETESMKIVAIIDNSEVEELRGITEDDFIKNSIILDPETRKVVETKTEV